MVQARDFATRLRMVSALALNICLLSLIVAPTYVSLNKVAIVDSRLERATDRGQTTLFFTTSWLDYARAAWRYFQPGVGVNPSTGLHYANKDWHRLTDWDLGDYLVAIVDAEGLGILNPEGEWGANHRLDKILDFLQTRPLNADGLPYLVYDSDTGGLPPEVTPVATNVYDSGRLFSALHYLAQHRPDLASTIDQIVHNRCNYTKLLDSFPTDATPEMYYIANGFRFFGFNNSRIQSDIDAPRRMMAGEQVEVYGVRLPKTNLISEQILHGMFELNPNPQFREIALKTYLVQEGRWMATGKFTAFTEGGYDAEPYYIYEYVLLPPKSWAIMAYGVGELSLIPVAYFKAALGFHALYHTSYTESMIQSLTDQLITDQGFYEGVDESGRVIHVLTDKTNSLVINAARYALESRLSLSYYPAPFLVSGEVNNTLVVIGESKLHGPCDPAHTIDTLGGMLVGSRIALEADAGQLKSAMDGWIVNYDPLTGATEMKDSASNLIVIGSPGVNLVAYHYNNSASSEGYSYADVLFHRNESSGQNYIRVQTSGNCYSMEFEGDRLLADYAAILIFEDAAGRYVMLAYGLGAEGTRIASEVLKNYDQYALDGRGVVLRYYDSDHDGALDTISIVEVIR